MSVQSTFLHIKCSLACLRVAPDRQKMLVSARCYNWLEDQVAAGWEYDIGERFPLQILFVDTVRTSANYCKSNSARSSALLSAWTA
jgi:hypothetical protein